MKFIYYSETDTLYLDFNGGESAESEEIADGFVVDFDAEGNIIGLDIDNASQKIDLNRLETVGFLDSISYLPLSISRHPKSTAIETPE